VLGKTIVDYWTNFAATGDPNNDGGSAIPLSSPRWPEFSTGKNLVLSAISDDGKGIRTETSAEVCNLWDSLGYGR